MTEKRNAITANLCLLLVAMAIITTACKPKCDQGVLIDVPARPANCPTDVFTPTNIQVNEGDIISFKASGRWFIRFNGGGVGPDGQEASCECPVSQPVSDNPGSGFKGQLGALIGRIGPNGEPFLIGSEKTITFQNSGTLYLTINDNMGPCDQKNRGSCFCDNRGSVMVCIKVATKVISD